MQDDEYKQGLPEDKENENSAGEIFETADDTGTLIGKIPSVHGTIVHADSITADVSSAPLSTVAAFIQVPLYIYEAYDLLTNKKKYESLSSEQRSLRISTAVAGAIITTASTIVGFLFKLHIGLLATTAAAAVIPILLPSIGLGLYAMILYRDLHRLWDIERAIALLEALQESAPIAGKKADPTTRIISRKLEVCRETRKQLLKNMTFIAFGATGAILLLTVAAIALTATPVGLAGVLLTAGVLIAISAIPAVTNLAKKVVRKISDFWHPSQENIPQAPDITPKPKHQKTPKSLLEFKDTEHHTRTRSNSAPALFQATSKSKDTSTHHVVKAVTMRNNKR